MPRSEVREDSCRQALTECAGANLLGFYFLFKMEWAENVFRGGWH